MPNRDELLYLNCELKIANAERLVRNSQRSQLAIIPFATPKVRNSQLIRSQPPKVVKSKFFFIFLFFPKLNHTIITYENS